MVSVHTGTDKLDRETTGSKDAMRLRSHMTVVPKSNHGFEKIEN